jgi:hypothetical protein
MEIFNLPATFKINDCSNAFVGGGIGKPKSPVGRLNMEVFEVSSDVFHIKPSLFYIIRG